MTIVPLPGQPREGEQPVFAEPWEAQAFALTVALREGGLFTWAEWAGALGPCIAAAQDDGDPDLGNTYYRHWCDALESLIAEKGVSSTMELALYRHAWDHAAGRTPHGQPVELQPCDFDVPQQWNGFSTDSVTIDSTR